MPSVRVRQPPFRATRPQDPLIDPVGDGSAAPRGAFLLLWGGMIVPIILHSPRRAGRAGKPLQRPENCCLDKPDRGAIRKGTVTPRKADRSSVAGYNSGLLMIRKEKLPARSVSIRLSATARYCAYSSLNFSCHNPSAAAPRGQPLCARVNRGDTLLNRASHRRFSLISARRRVCTTNKEINPGNSVNC